MSRNLKNCMHKLKVISQIKDSKIRKKVLTSMADDCLYKALNEIAINTVNKKVPLSIGQKKKLRKYRIKIQKLAIPTSNRKKRKQLVIQSGGFLQFLIPAVAAILPEIIRAIVKR